MRTNINDTKSTSFVVYHPRSLWADNRLLFVGIFFDLSLLFAEDCQLGRICHRAFHFVLSVLKKSWFLCETAFGFFWRLDLFISFLEVKLLRKVMVFQLLGMRCLHEKTLFTLRLAFFVILRLMRWDFRLKFRLLREQFIVKLLVICPNSNHIHIFRS